MAKDGGDVTADVGKYLEIHKRQDDGTWRFHCHKFSSDAAKTAGTIEGAL